MTEPLPTIALCVPSKDEWKADMACSFGALMAYTRGRVSANLRIFNRKGAMISNQRNECVKHALDNGDEYILWIDSDMVFPPQTLHALLLRDKDIVGATYNKRLPPYETLGYWTGKPDLSKGGLIEALFLPGGMLLVKTAVYRRLGYPWYFETYRWRGGSETDKFFNMLDDVTDAPMPESLRAKLTASKDLRDWLDKSHEAVRNQTGDIVSEDNNFCRRARKAGFSMWCDLDLSYRIAHIGEQHVVMTPTKSLDASEAPDRGAVAVMEASSV